MGSDRLHQGASARPTPQRWHRVSAIELTESVLDRSAIEARGEFARIGVDIVDGADVAVVNLLVVVVLDLHYLIAKRKDPTEPLDFVVGWQD